MPNRIHSFELSASAIDLPISWTYDKKYEEGTIDFAGDNVSLLMAHAAHMVQVWLKEIDSQRMDLELDNMPLEWMGELK